MWRVVIIALVFTVGCARHDEPRAPFAKEWWCTLRVEPSRMFVDGDPTSLADAITYCKRTTGAMIVEHDDGALWNATRLALQREGVRIYVRGPICYDPRRDGCRPIKITPKQTEATPRALIVTKPLVMEIKPPKVIPLVTSPPVTATPLVPPAVTSQPSN